MRLREFFQEFYRDLGGYLVGWRADTKGSVWTSSLNLDEIEAFAAKSKRENFDSYFGVSLQRERTDGRGSAFGASVVPGVWVDIDFAGKPGENKSKNYPTREIAVKALELMPAKPTVVLATGGGLHVYWLFNKPFVIETEQDRERMASLVKSWQGLLKAKLMKLGGYGLDSTFDLARVMRIPGTVHTKHPDRIVEVESHDWSVRYTVEAFEDWLFRGLDIQQSAAPAPKKKKVAAAPSSAPLAVTADADPPGTKLANLMEASPEFTQLWSGKVKRGSPSEYDMSLANFAINAGWSDMEAAALLVAFCRKHQPSHMDKLLRVNGGVQDYLKLTIGKAHDRRVVDAEMAKAETAVEELALEVREAAREKRDPGRGVVLSKVSTALGVNVVGFLQTGRREEVYSLLVRQDSRVVEVSIGSAAAIHSSPQRMLERIMAECGRHVPLTPKLKKEWGTIVAGLISIREFHDLVELELSSRVRALVDEHLARKAGGYWVTDAAARVRCASRGEPFIEGDLLFVYGSALKRLAHEIDRGIAGGELYVGLRGAGFEQVTVALHGAKASSRSYWKAAVSGFTVSERPEEVVQQ